MEIWFFIRDRGNKRQVERFETLKNKDHANGNLNFCFSICKYVRNICFYGISQWKFKFFIQAWIFGSSSKVILFWVHANEKLKFLILGASATFNFLGIRQWEIDFLTWLVIGNVYFYRVYANEKLSFCNG